MAGSATLARREADFRGSIYPLLEAIEEQVTLLQADERDGRGRARPRRRASDARTSRSGWARHPSLASDYDATGSRARVGVLGPDAHGLPTNLAAVRAVARYLTRMLEEDESSR